MPATAQRVSRAWATIAVAPPQAGTGGCNGCGLPTPMQQLVVGLGYCRECAGQVIDPDVWVSDQAVVDLAAVVLQPHPYVLAHRNAMAGLQPTLGSAPLASLPEGTALCTDCEERFAVSMLGPEGNCHRCAMAAEHDKGLHDGSDDDYAPSALTIRQGCDQCLHYALSMGWLGNGTDADAKEAANLREEAEARQRDIQERAAKVQANLKAIQAKREREARAHAKEARDRQRNFARAQQQERDEQIKRMNERVAKGETVLYMGEHHTSDDGTDVRLWRVWGKGNELHRVVGCAHGEVMYCYSPGEANTLLNLHSVWCPTQ